MTEVSFADIGQLLAIAVIIIKLFGRGNDDFKNLRTDIKELYNRVEMIETQVADVNLNCERNFLKKDYFYEFKNDMKEEIDALKKIITMIEVLNTRLEEMDMQIKDLARDIRNINKKRED